MYYRPHGCGSHGWGRRQLFNASPVNITETEDAYTIRLYAPGLTKENISLTTERDVLSVTYRADKDESNERFTRREYRPENIERSFDLKGKVDVDNISSFYREGILTVQLPKTEYARRPAQQVPVT